MSVLPAERIDRSFAVPFYFQLKTILAQEIISGRWKPGFRMPSEPMICEHFGVSRTTVRQALAELEAEGFVTREKGRGTFVAERRDSSWLLQSSHGFYEEALRGGQKVASRVLRLEVAPLPRWAADLLGMPVGADGVALERLRWVDDRIVMYSVNHLVPEVERVLAAADLEQGSLTVALEQDGRHIAAGGRRHVEAVLAEGRLIELLELPRGAPLLFVESVTWGADGRPFDCYRAWHRADRTKIEIQVVHDHPAARATLGLPAASSPRLPRLVAPPGPA